MVKRGEHALVLGASMGGLLAARVLADFYRTVTVVERDVLPDDPANRRGVPQGRHAHVLLGRGSQILGELFPGLLDELVASGAPFWDGVDFSQLFALIGGHRLVPSGSLREPQLSSQYFPSRCFLECHVRRRLRAITNVTILDGHDLVKMTSTAQGDRITGVRVVNRDDAGETTVAADLVVDAMGRGSRTPAFLEGLGYGRPQEDEVVVHLAYATQLLRIPPGALKENLVLVSAQPGRPTTFALVGYENDTWMLSMTAMLGHEPPSRRADMLALALEFAPAHAVAAVRAAEPLGEVARYRVPSNRWRRYDKMRRIPEGLLVVGDAICSFNPIYGQGMTVAALDATALRDCLRHGEHDLARRFFRATAKKIGVAWQMSAGSDLTQQKPITRRSPSMRITNAYLDRVLAAAESDPFVAEKFLRVTGMIDSPAHLLHPSLMFRIATTNRRRRRDNHPV